MTDLRPALVGLILAAAVVRADVVVMRDGTERTGTIDLCDEGVCRLDGTQIPRDQISAILFDESARKIRPGAAGVVLRDGTLRRGGITFLNRGSVEIEGGDVDRSDVLAVFFDVPRPPPDLLLLRDGTARRGTLAGCNAASCTFEGGLVRLNDVVWIGLAREDVTPPATTGRDEVHRIDGSIVPARLSRVDDTTVATTRGSFPRADTAWIQMAPPPVAAPPPGAFGAPSDPPRPPVASREDWPPRIPRAGAPPRRGGLWTGTVIARYRQTDGGGGVTRWFIDARVKLRERIIPIVSGTGAAVRSVGSLAWLVPEGSVLTQKITYRGGGLTCDGEGTITVSGEADRTCAAWWWKDADVDLSSQYGYDVPRNGMYSVCVGPGALETFPYTCRSAEGSSSVSVPYGSPVIGRHPILSPDHFMDPNTRSFDGGAARMAGSFFQPATAEHGSFRVSWSICRDTANCPPPGPLPPDPEDPDDCAPPATQQALLDRALDELRARYRELSELRAEYRRIEQQAAAWEGDYAGVMRDCGLFNLAKTLTGILLGNWAPKIPGAKVIVNPASPGAAVSEGVLPGIEPGKTFVNFVNFVDKVVEGDPSWMLPDAEFGPGGRDWWSAEDVWDGATVGWKYLQSVGATPAEMREKLLSCGSPSIAAAKEGALKYLQYLEQLEPVAARMNDRLNDIRNLESNQIEGDLWPDYQRQCVAYELCREGGDPSSCNRLPPRPAQ